MNKIVKNENKPELFFGLVAPLGANIESLETNLKNSLKDVGYNIRVIKLSDLLRNIWTKPLPKRNGPLDIYINKLQNAGDEFRDKTKLKDAFAYLCVAKVRDFRTSITGRFDQPAYGTAYIISSLKTPEEYKKLSRIYGDSFFLIGTTKDRDKRVTYLSKIIASSRHHTGSGEEFRDKAEKLITRDYKDNQEEFGQNVQNTFPYSSLFVDSNNLKSMKNEINRLIEIIFGYQFHTPTIDEYMMYHAHAAALRSADLSRQVGAAISTDDGHLLTVGTNEVPKASGGLYWSSDDTDDRDFKREEDSNYTIKNNMIIDLLERLKKEKFLSESLSKKRIKSIIEKVYPYLKEAEFMDITEYGRTVHAEMAAILDAAYRGVSIKRANLFSTTFPCHNCTKHILATGIKEVVYIEPYPKSKASILHSDSIRMESDGDKNKVLFRPFIGISPKSYLKCFTMIDRKDNLGKVRKWTKHDALPKILYLPELSYLRLEDDAIFKLADIKSILAK